MNAHDAICKAAHDALCKLRIPHADHVWTSPVPFFDYVADEIAAAVAAAGYTITLTDDGAAAPPADKGAANTPAAESATTTAAPSSPHLRTALEKLVQQWQYSDGKGFRGFYEAVESLLAAYPIGAATPFELEFELISWHRKEGYEAGLAARGATPAIDREALKYLLSYHYYDAKWSKEHQGFRCVCGWLGEDHVQHVVDLIAGAS